MYFTTLQSKLLNIFCTVDGVGRCAHLFLASSQAHVRYVMGKYENIAYYKHVGHHTKCEARRCAFVNLYKLENFIGTDIVRVKPQACTTLL